MIVPWTLVLPLRRNTERVVVPRWFTAATPSMSSTSRAMASLSPPMIVMSANRDSA